MSEMELCEYQWKLGGKFENFQHFTQLFSKEASGKNSTRDRERPILYDITYLWNLKKHSKLVNITKKKQTHRFRE